MESGARGQKVARFGLYEADVRQRVLTKAGLKVRLQDQPFQVLALLLERPGELVTREEIQQKLWPADTYVAFDDGLNTAIKKLRSALSDTADNPRFIETVPRRGYRFVAPVNVLPDPQLATGIQRQAIAPLPSESDPSQAKFPVLQGLNHDTDNGHVSSTGITNGQVGTAASAVPTRVSSRAKLGRYPAAGVILLAALSAVGFYYRAHRARPLTDKDTVVITDFTNSTGDPVFDDTLKTALSVSLDQSPFLSVLSDNKVASTLKLMTRRPDTRLTPEIARELCQRAGSEVYIAGSIASLGSQYVLELKAVNCQSGEPLAQEQATANGKEKVLDTLETAASKLRGQLGESLASVQKLDAPLEQATTSSLEALKAYSLGLKVSQEEGQSAALPYHQHAIELDPQFAVGFAEVGDDYFGLGELGRASGYYTKAFQLRDHASEREKLAITADYYRNVTGEVDKAVQTLQEWIATYPRDYTAHAKLGTAYSKEGQFEKAAEAYRDAIRLAPDYVGVYGNLANALISLQRFDEVEQTAAQEQARKLDDETSRAALYAVAFLRGDGGGMAEQQQWFVGRPEQDWGLSLASDAEAYAGHLHRARELSRRSLDTAVRNDSKETGAIWLENSALREAAFGNLTHAKQTAEAGLKLVPTSQAVAVEATLAYAMAGDRARAESLAQDLNKLYPLDTQMQSLWLPAIRAQLALNRGDATTALSSLQPALPPIEYGQIMFLSNLSCLYPTYIRGEAYLEAGRGAAAAAEFQKILDHSGIVWNCWTGALARLGVARANALQAGIGYVRTSRFGRGASQASLDRRGHNFAANAPAGSSADSGIANRDAARVRALAAYKDFLTLWKDADIDTDIPIYQQAKAEYAALR